MDILKNTQPKHTPEPWREGKWGGSIVADSPVPGMKGSDDVEHYGGHLVGESITRSNRRRIIACVNACQGIPTEELESGSIRALDAVYHALGWQGGTIHQVVRRIESLVRLEKEVEADTLAKLEGRQC